MRIIALFAILLSVHAKAADFSVSVNTRQSLQTEKVVVENNEFTKISLNGFESTHYVGAPQLPVKSWLVIGKPGDIKVTVETQQVSQVLNSALPFPAQAEPCRCETDKQTVFAYDQAAYNEQSAAYKLTYIGAFRGVGIHRLDIPLAAYNAKNGSVEIYSNVKVSTNTKEYSFQSEEYKNYLILVTEQYAQGVQLFADWRRSQGFNVTVETLLAPQLTTSGVAAVIKKHYDNKNVDFLMIIGDAKQIPMNSVDTSGSYATPSDLPYLTMDGAGDHVPDMFASRVVANSNEDIQNRLTKASEFELKSVKNVLGLTRAVGISSNEGQSPSDADYINAILNKYKDTLGMTTLHLNQNDSHSTPENLNIHLDQGAFWMTYVGHGSGTSWPSMRQPYSVSDVVKLRNMDSVKPVIIDVACMNGRVEKGYLGEQFAGVWTSNQYQPFGSSAYYGGTVNISWHPPAVMARGIAFEHMSKNFRYLGEALMAGQLYLAANYAGEEEVIDNMEWYHLQGDPGMSVHY